VEFEEVLLEGLDAQAELDENEERGEGACGADFGEEVVGGGVGKELGDSVDVLAG